METFQDIINSGLPVLIDFHATWCAPCKMMSPVVETVGKEVQGKARVLKIDVDRNPTLSQAYQIRSVPTFMIFKDGKIVWRHSGGIEKNSLYNTLMNFA